LGVPILTQAKGAGILSRNLCYKLDVVTRQREEPGLKMPEAQEQSSQLNVPCGYFPVYFVFDENALDINSAGWGNISGN
jgi:hypothetical protein